VVIYQSWYRKLQQQRWNENPWLRLEDLSTNKYSSFQRFQQDHLRQHMKNTQARIEKYKKEVTEMQRLSAETVE
jgi:benzoyl-CoA reductase/2-hydroxyglutaryl-CoA dehydratase subunit BcrC/BadD/HgdB